HDLGGVGARDGASADGDPGGVNGHPDGAPAAFDAASGAVFDLTPPPDLAVFIGCDNAHPCVNGLACSGGQCPDTSNNPAHCGACGTACAAGQACCQGGCVAMAGMFCGPCQPCAPPNAVPACANGQCVIGSCATGYSDCNQRAADGCESDTSSDP